MRHSFLQNAHYNSFNPQSHLWRALLHIHSEARDRFIISWCILNDMSLQHFIRVKFYAASYGCSLFDAFKAQKGFCVTLFYRQVAHMLGLKYLDDEQLRQADFIIKDDLAQTISLTNMRARNKDGDKIIICAPNIDGFVAIQEGMQSYRINKDILYIAAPKPLRAHLLHLHRDTLVTQATQALYSIWPQVRLQHQIWRSFPLLLFSGLCALTLWGFFNSAALIVLLIISAIFFMLPALMRFCLTLYGLSRRKNAIAALPYIDLPVYSVLIPLLDEAHMVPQIMDAMSQLDYPVAKLDIKFVVESHCQNTIDAVHSYANAPHFDLIIVPSCNPQTKPKALNYALPLCRGKYVVVYDAEDIPHPKQLREVATLFAQDPQLGCVQAELHIDNANDSLFTHHLAAEYAVQFGGILPGLSYLNQPMPLGGTSNHFRTTQLRQMGAWDAFNVTEDADLGIRLARLGKKCATLTRPTYEEAPVHLINWYKQRTRWLKGWMQTWLAHSSNPFLLFKELGLIRFVVFQLLIGGMIMSTPLHLVLVTATVTNLVINNNQFSNPLFLTGLAILSLGYAGTIAANILGLRVSGRTLTSSHAFTLFIYWTCTSCAAIRAMWQLTFSPFKWEKTPHGITKYKRLKASERYFQ